MTPSGVEKPASHDVLVDGCDLDGSLDSSDEYVAEPPNLMSHRSACLPLDTKHSRENTKLLGFVGHTPGENPKTHIFATRITNERIKLTSFLTISYITFNTTSEYNIYCYNNGM